MGGYQEGLSLAPASRRPLMNWQTEGGGIITGMKASAPSAATTASLRAEVPTVSTSGSKWGSQRFCMSSPARSPDTGWKSGEGSAVTVGTPSLALTPPLLFHQSEKKFLPLWAEQTVAFLLEF